MMAIQDLCSMKKSFKFSRFCLIVKKLRLKVKATLDAMLVLFLGDG